MSKRTQPRLFLAAATACLMALGVCATVPAPNQVARGRVNDTATTFSTALARGVPAAAAGISRTTGEMLFSLSLSVPIELVLQIVAEITGQSGTSRPRLGAGFEDVTPFVAIARGRPYANGALINEVRPGGLAASMGVRKGDIVVGMNGRPIGDSADFADALLRWRAGEAARLTVFREGRYRRLTTAP